MSGIHDVASPSGDRAVEGSFRRLLLLGGHSLYHTALQWLIENRSRRRVAVQIVSEDQAFTTADADLVLLDLDLLSTNEARLVEMISILEKLAPRPVLLITAGIEPATLQRLLRHGIAGVILKTSRCENLLEAIDSAWEGKVWLEREVLAQTFSDSHVRRPCSQASQIAHLTQRERDIIAVAAMGLTNRQIAERLLISEATVRHHLSSIFGKVGVASRAELIVFAYRHRLVGEESREIC